MVKNISKIMKKESVATNQVINGVQNILITDVNIAC